MNTAADTGLDEDHSPCIWDPDLLGFVSLPLTPIFGSILLARNWRELGEDKEAKIATRWLIVSLLMLLPSLQLPGLYVAYFIAWYFVALRKQLSYVRVRHHGRYRRKSWALPLFAGLGVVVLIAGGVVLLALKAGHH